MNKPQSVNTYVGLDGFNGRSVKADGQYLEWYYSRCLIDYGEARYGWGANAAAGKQLAVSILLEETGSCGTALALRLRLWDEIISILPEDSWVLKGDEVRQWITDTMKAGGKTWPWGANGDGK